MIISAVYQYLPLCSHSVVVSPCGITSISYRTWINREARDPSLLVSCGDGLLRLYRILPDGAVYLKRKFPVPPTTHSVKSVFCPLMSFLQVSGEGPHVIHMYCACDCDSRVRYMWKVICDNHVSLHMPVWSCDPLQGACGHVTAM